MSLPPCWQRAAAQAVATSHEAGSCVCFAGTTCHRRPSLGCIILRGTGERCPACRVSALPSGVMSRHPRAAPIWALKHWQPSEPQKPLRGAGSWMDRQTDVSSGMGGDGDSFLSPSWEVEAAMKSCGDQHLGTHPAAHQQDLPQIRFFFTKNLSFCRAPDPRPASPPPPA